jgi:hypothetical protein
MNYLIKTTIVKNLNVLLGLLIQVNVSYWYYRIHSLSHCDGDIPRGTLFFKRA